MFKLWDIMTLSYNIISVDTRFLINILIINSAIAAFIIMFCYLKKRISLIKSSWNIHFLLYKNLIRLI